MRRLWRPTRGKPTHSYTAYPRRFQAQAAQAFCQGHGGNLASIQNKMEEDIVLRVMDRHCAQHSAKAALIGLQSEPSRVMRWSDGTPARYTRWKQGHPARFPSTTFSEVTMEGWQTVPAHHMSDCIICEVMSDYFDSDGVSPYISAEQTCINDCSQHGDCEWKTGMCNCDTGWTGEDCSVDSGAVSNQRQRSYSVLNLMKTPFVNGKARKTQVTIAEAASHCKYVIIL